MSFLIKNWKPVIFLYLAFHGYAHNAHNAHAQTCRELFATKALLIKEVLPTSNSLRAMLYSEGLVSADSFSANLANKLYASRLLHQHSPLPQHVHLSRAMGLLEFLNQKSNIPLEEKLKIDFPNGFVVKLTSEKNSYGSGMILKTDELVRFLDQPDRNLGSLDNERYMIEELHPGTIFSQGHKEFRIHTLGAKVINGATLSRWQYWQDVDPAITKSLHESIEQFLQTLPAWMTNKQAWSLDVTITRDGVWKLIEINTNNGLQGNWSGFFLHPRVASAYFLHLQNNFGWKLKPQLLSLIRHQFINYRTYVRKELIETENETTRDAQARLEEVRSILADLLARSEHALIQDSTNADLLEVNLFIKDIFQLVNQSTEIGDHYWQTAKEKSEIRI